MTTQLPLTAEPIAQAERLATYVGYADSSTRPARDKAAWAAEQFLDRFGCLPVRIHCHADDAAAIGPCLPSGVGIVGDGRARNLFLAGPRPEGN